MKKQKNNTELVSIIVPVYRVEKYLKACVNSLINQTYNNIEIILIDDGSDDNCPIICDELQKIDSRIKVIHKKNGGLSDARNYGLKKCLGQYVTFVDSDDTVKEDYVEYLMNLIYKYNIKLSVCAYILMNDNKIISTQEKDYEKKICQKEALRKIMYQEDINVATCAKMYKKELFNNIEFPVGRIFEDTLTTYKLILKCENIAVGLKGKYNYMIRSNSIMTSSFSEKKLDLVTATEEMTNSIIKRYPELKDAKKRCDTYSRLSVLRQMVFAKPRYKEKEIEFRKYIIRNKKDILKDKYVPRRDKIAIILISLGIFMFKICWTIYCKITHRI